MAPVRTIGEVNRELTTCLFGAPLDSGNRGVEAMGRSIVAGLASVTPQGHVTIFDNGWGIRSGDRQGELTVDYCGVRRSRRIYRGESWANVNLSLRIPSTHNVVAELIRSCDLVLDISGGDSFSDLYGMDRLRAVLAPKLASLRAGRPLALLPQTYGPFTGPAAQRRAADVIKRAAVAWSRDDESLAVLQQLLGTDFDPQRHRRGVDVAFALEPRRPEDRPEWMDKLLHRRGTTPIVGVNVSGLLDTRDPGFDLQSDYGAAMRDLVARLAEDAFVVLVPHSGSRDRVAQSDPLAADRLWSGLPPATAGRVHVAPDNWRADELKWLISQFDWFCGARMHAAIAALSTATPVCAVAYSRKFRGVFRTCDAEELVVDARSVSTHELTESALRLFERRDETRLRLAATTPATVRLARQQIMTIVETAMAV